MKKRERGFTLVELMIVVAIIAILAVTALPAFGQQARKAKDSKAISLMGSMRSQLSMIISEMDGVNPKNEVDEMKNLFMESGGNIVTGADGVTTVKSKGISSFSRQGNITGDGVGNMMVGTCLIGTTHSGYVNWGYNNTDGTVKFTDATAKTAKGDLWKLY